MSANPYDPNANSYGGGHPYNTNYGGGGSQQPTPGPSPMSGPPFVDPYQPQDRQPTYLPAVRRSELQSMPRSSAAGGATAALGGIRSVGMTTGNGEGRMGAVACLLLCAVVTLAHGALLALAIAAVFYAVNRADFAKDWARNCFNFLLTYLALGVLMYMVLGIVDAVGGGQLRTTVGDIVRWVFAGAFAVGAVAAIKNRFFSFPLQVPAIKS